MLWPDWKRVGLLSAAVPARSISECRVGKSRQCVTATAVVSINNVMRTYGGGGEAFSQAEPAAVVP